MPSSNQNIIGGLRAKHEPHQKLAGRVLGLENRVSKLEGGGTKALPPASDIKKIGADSFKKGTALDPGYASRVQGKDATGEYLSPEERKAQFKKTKITGADIKKGSSVAGADNIAEEQAAMQKAAVDKAKIDLATKYEGSPADSVKPADAEAEKGGASAKGTESLIGPLKNIDSGVNGIIETLKKSNKADVKAKNDARKRAEKEARAQKEGKLEGIKGKLSNAAETVLKPVQSIFSKIWDFLKTVFLGRVVMKLFEWFTNPANGEKIASLMRFLKDWWPVLVAGIMAVVGPGIIFTAGLIALLVWGIPKIIEAVKWVGSLFGMGVDKELKTVEGEADKFAQGTSKEIEKEGVTPKDEKGGETKAEVGDTEAPATDVTPPEVSETQQKAEDVQTGADSAEPLQMAGGGHVPGSGSGDTVPAMLTPGEFVMSKGAVQRYGSGTLAGMNAAAGGTNRPTMGRYSTGGPVQNSRGGLSLGGPKINYASGGPKIHYSGGGMVNSIRSGTTINVPQTVIPRQPLRFAGGGSVPEAKIVKSSPSTIVINPPPGASPSVVVEDDPIANANAKIGAQGVPDQELPEFSATKMRSISKIKTLGIVV